MTEIVVIKVIKVSKLKHKAYIALGDHKLEHLRYANCCYIAEKSRARPIPTLAIPNTVA